ncbi:MAG: restriction endonuclease subunit S [Chloroflexi bacterium]|nr:restriction endonuclease subunit S [Chloroflexota bacterium]
MDLPDEIYVGLDDLDSGSLHIRRWGRGSDVIGTKLRFRKGDIVFGRRRAYQRKLAVAEMDGICSAHAMVVRAKPNVVLPEFLPFLMMSDRFMNRAVEISVGSLSPTINWSTLKLEEFDLPALDQQRRMAEILWAVDEVSLYHDSLSAVLEQTRSSVVGEHFKVAASTGRRQNLGSVADVSYGITLGGYRATLLEQRPYLRVANVLRERLDLSEIKTINCTRGEAARFALRNGDVLVVEGHANVKEIGRAAVWCGELSPMLHQNHLMRVRCSNVLLPDYLNLYINSARGRAYIRSHAKSTSGLNTINSTVLKELLVPISPIENQTKLTTTIRQLDSAFASIKSAQVQLRSWLRCFVTEVVV